MKTTLFTERPRMAGTGHSVNAYVCEILLSAHPPARRAGARACPSFLHIVSVHGQEFSR